MTMKISKMTKTMMKTTTNRRKRQEYIFVGVDPGASAGRIAGIDEKCRLKFVQPLPSVQFPMSKPTKSGNQSFTSRTCEQQVTIFFRRLKKWADKHGYRLHVIVESLHPTGGIKAKGLAIAMHSAGIVCGVLAALGISFELVSPDEWQGVTFKYPKNVKPKGVNPKEISLQHARRTFSDAIKYLQAKNADGVADALHMANFGRRKVLCLAS